MEFCCTQFCILVYAYNFQKTLFYPYNYIIYYSHISIHILKIIHFNYLTLIKFFIFKKYKEAQSSSFPLVQ